jgi:hypothetical protein
MRRCARGCVVHVRKYLLLLQRVLGVVQQQGVQLLLLVRGLAWLMLMMQQQQQVVLARLLAMIWRELMMPLNQKTP